MEQIKGKAEKSEVERYVESPPRGVHEESKETDQVLPQHKNDEDSTSKDSKVVAPQPTATI